MTTELVTGLCCPRCGVTLINMTAMDDAHQQFIHGLTIKRLLKPGYTGPCNVRQWELVGTRLQEVHVQRKTS
jgi:hypothetical protein